ncbi:MAG: sugar ABC transporter permease [Chloroflexi bacterium]|nr:MAG: sugar ABC transporter permease [Chloroflexota bacterium]TMG07991.1 MAG: sugar ABC transporter permease [Chloroflexota bacterium]TMG22570.1 MAG: sugar ABC transporter permease [Chloroflexota bacterium]TMG68127.1 MAG: sugar ABC transporter permease [Chloroflexota bacterium]
MDQVITAVVAVIGVPLVLLGYIVLGERVIERLPDTIQTWIRPYFWALPAIGFATIFMVYPLLRTVFLSFRNNADTDWVGFNNYVYFFTFPDTLTSLRNSLLWLIFYTFFAVGLGLIIAILLDRVRYEQVAKIAIFLPVPISAVAASIIWKFMFDYQPPGSVQTGTLNAAIGAFGGQPVAWLVNSTTNNPALIFVGIWSITGFCMVIISASLKSISTEVLEAARIDGANEFRIVQLIVTPLLWPTITVVGTTMIINALKTFDIVYVLTSGAYDTDVIATNMFRQLATSHYARAAAVGVVLFLAIVPLLVVNIRRFQQQEETR